MKRTGKNSRSCAAEIVPSVGERLLREFQWEAAGRMFKRGDFLLAPRGADRDREVASGVQHQAAALGAGLQAASAGDVRAS
jgi:hypothetical protein